MSWQTLPVSQSPQCSLSRHSVQCAACQAQQCIPMYCHTCTNTPPSSARSRETTDRAAAAIDDENKTHTQRTSGQNLRDALVDGPATSGFRLTGRKADHLGRLHNQQGTRNPPALVMGYDLRLLAQWKLRGMRWFGQHMLHLQSVGKGRADSRRPGVEWSLRLPQLLSVHQRPAHTHIFWRHDLRSVGH